MKSRLGPFIFAQGFRPTPAQATALGLVNEMDAEKRISTPDAMVLLAALAGVPTASFGFTPELLKVVRPQSGWVTAPAKEEATSCSRS